MELNTPGTCKSSNVPTTFNNHGQKHAQISLVAKYLGLKITRQKLDLKGLHSIYQRQTYI